MEQIWLRQDGESIKAYTAFCAYRDMPPNERTIEKIRESWKTASNWATRWNWRKRVEAYELHLDNIRREEKEEALRKGLAMQASIAASLLYEIHKSSDSLEVRARAFKAVAPEHRIALGWVEPKQVFINEDAKVDVPAAAIDAAQGAIDAASEEGEDSWLP